MIDGRQFLNVAEVLADHSGEEFVRARIGRLHYAAWIEARSFCEERLGYSRTKMAREHQAIASLLGTIDSSLTYELRTLRSARNAADYDNHLTEQHMADLLDVSLESASWILSRLDALRDTE